MRWLLHKKIFQDIGAFARRQRGATAEADELPIRRGGRGFDPDKFVLRRAVRTRKRRRRQFVCRIAGTFVAFGRCV